MRKGSGRSGLRAGPERVRQRRLEGGRPYVEVENSMAVVVGEQLTKGV